MLPVLIGVCAALQAQAEPRLIEINARPIENFQIGSTETKFGRLVFNGGLEMTSPDSDFGSISAWRYRDGGSSVLAVSDNGFWISGRISRDKDGHPDGFKDARLLEMTNPDGSTDQDKWNSDAEGLIVEGDAVTVSFERNHRISTGTLDAATMQFKSVDEPLPVPARELRSNRGFEALAQSPASGPLKGARVTVTEKSLNAEGNLFAAIMDGPGKGVFFVKRDGEFDVSDGDFLPNGDLLILERKFTMAEGVAMRIRQIKGADIKAGATVTGQTLLSADMGYQIDNMECLDVWQRADGKTMVSLASDDNHSLLQRNLYLEFRLADE